MSSQSIGDQLRDSRPNLSDSSVRTYSSLLRSLYRKLDGDDIPNIDYREFFTTGKTPSKVLALLAPIEPSKRKTVLSALTVLCHSGSACDKYRAQMLEDSEKAREALGSEEKNDRQKAEWMDWDQIVSIHNQLAKETAPLFSKTDPSMADFSRMQDYVLLSLYVLQPPRRSEDYTLMRLRGGAKKKDDAQNYIDGKRFRFNKWKTSAISDGPQYVDISPKMSALLNKWKKVNNYEWLLVNPRNGTSMSTSDLTKRLNRITGKKISSNMLRHIYLSHTYDREKMEKLAQDMGHSVNEAVNVYAKK